MAGVRGWFASRPVPIGTPTDQILEGALRDALVQQGLVHVETVHLAAGAEPLGRRSLPADATARLSVPVGVDEDAVVLLEQQEVYAWSIPVARIRPPTVTRRGGLRDLLRAGRGHAAGSRRRTYRDTGELQQSRRRHQRPRRRVDAQLVFAVAEDIKARTLLERLSVRSALRSRLLGQDELERAQVLERRIATLDARIALEGHPVARNALTVERDDQLRRWRILDRTFKEASPAYARVSEVRQIDFAAAVGHLTEDETFLSLIAHGDQVAAVWVSTTGCGCLHIGRLAGLEETIAALQALLSEPQGLAGLLAGNGGTRPRTIVAEAHGGFRLVEEGCALQDGERPVSDAAEILTTVSRSLLDALPSSVFEARRLLISPDGPLAAIPFEVLARGGKRLVDTHEIAYLQSLSLAASMKAESRKIDRRLPMIAVGAPSFSHGLDTSDLTSATSALAAAVRRRQDRHAAWSELPGAAMELAAVKEMFGLVEGETLFDGAEATIERVRSLASSGTLGRAASILFASHGYLDPRDPSRNAIVLGSVSPMEAGMLTAAELAGYDLTADLVVLSACDSGGGTFLAGEGLLGLPFALTAAGCRSVVQTLWSVYDVPSATLVKRFFELYRTGLSASSALVQTKREMSAGDHGTDFVEPAYWAPYLIYGR